MVIKKRGAVYSVIALMLCVAVYLNWSYNRDPDAAAAAASGEGKNLGETQLVSNTDILPDTQAVVKLTEDDFFAEARLSRQKARDEAATILNATIGNQNATDEARNNAQATLAALSDGAVKEARIESLVIAKGYSDCVVFISDNGVKVIIPKQPNGVQSQDIAKIKDIVISESGVTASEINIIESA